MPTRQKHRGKHPRDHTLFAPSEMEDLYMAAHDLAWLLEKDYPENGSLKLVGDRFRLTSRQRKAVMRITCQPGLIHRIRQNAVGRDILKGARVGVDGFNVLIFCETLLSGGIVFETLDGVFRDISSVHGSYHRVRETPGAMALIAGCLKALQVGHTEWYLDAPVSNSGQLARALYAYASEHQLPWTVKVVHNPDRDLIESGLPVLSSDRYIISRAGQWFNLTRALIFPDFRAAENLRLIPDAVKQIT